MVIRTLHLIINPNPKKKGMNVAFFMETKCTLIAFFFLLDFEL